MYFRANNVYFYFFYYSICACHQRNANTCDYDSTKQKCLKPCKNNWTNEKCKEKKQEGKCDRDNVEKNCPLTCEKCCGDIWSAQNCLQKKMNGECNKGLVKVRCAKTCGKC